jgi:hypothetical protein
LTRRDEASGNEQSSLSGAVPITIIEGDGLGTIITGKTTTGTVATYTHDHPDRNARDHALPLGASRR